MKPQPSPNVPAPGRASSLAIAALALTTMAAGTPSGVGVHDPWMRSIIPSRPAAGYLTLTNDSDTQHTLVGASSPGCGMLMLHKSVNESGQEKMVMVKSILLPAHGKVAFAPGGYHLMCMEPTSEVKPGGSVPVTLRFSNGDTLTATFPVRNAMGK
jgi:periplasmic copper chaperone A